MQRAHWWGERGAFVDALFARQAPAGEGDPGSGWVWLSEQESREAAERIEKEAAEEESCFQGWIAPEAHEACREMLSGCVPLATRGELRADRIMGKLHRPTLFGDPSRPEQVFLALDEGAPPPLWIPCGTTADSLAEAWAPYAYPETEGPLPTIVSMSSSVRIFIGSERDMGADFPSIAEYFRKLPGADGLPWGTRYTDDPWPPRLSGIALASAGYRMAEFMAQIDEDAPILTTRSRRLGAAMSLSKLD